MARKPGGPPPVQNKRSAPVPAGAAAGSPPAVRKTATPDAPRAAGNPITWITGLPKFINEVRAEARKITWTTWRETWITSTMVFAMVLLASIFFWIIDQLLGNGMQLLLHFAT